MEAVEADEEEGTVFSLAAHTEYLATKYPGIVIPECPWSSSEEEEGRKKEEKEEERETTDPMPTLGSSQLQCRGCNSTLAESDLSSWDDLNQSPKRAGLSRLAETEDAPACAACLNHWSL